MRQKKFQNPFVLQPYVSAELFCDRVREMNEIISHIRSGSNVTMISIRRIGKTGLILRTFDELSKPEYGFMTVYADIYATSNLEEFTKTLAEAVVNQCGKTGIRQFFSKLGNLRPLLSYDPISGQPQVSITYQAESQKAATLKSIFDYLEGLGRPVVVAIDEFQQIREYSDVHMEALLRTYIQNLHNVRFIFSGSKKHLMTDMFCSEKAPFYQSAANVPIAKLNADIYADFIISKFKSGGKSIQREVAGYIIEWSRCHTFYTQCLCNEIYSHSSTEVGIEDVYYAINSIFSSEADKFYTIRAMLTKSQWRYLGAVAKEGRVTQPTARDFLLKYKIGTPAASMRCLKALVDKELLLENVTAGGTEYSVYNVFLSRWLEK